MYHFESLCNWLFLSYFPNSTGKKIESVMGSLDFLNNMKTIVFHTFNATTESDVMDPKGQFQGHVSGIMISNKFGVRGD